MKTLDYRVYQKCNIYLGAPSNIIARHFKQGLICTIYPSPQLTKLQKLPAFILKGIQEFISILGHSNIYIRFYSACPKWGTEDGYIPGNHLIKIGVTQKPLSPNNACTQHITTESMSTIPKKKSMGPQDIYNQLLNFILETKVYGFTSTIKISQSSPQPQRRQKKRTWKF